MPCASYRANQECTVWPRQPRRRAGAGRGRAPLLRHDVQSSRATERSSISGKRATLVVRTGLPKAKLQGKMRALRADIETEMVDVFTSDALLLWIEVRAARLSAPQPLQAFLKPGGLHRQLVKV